ncbi:MAG: hypothetical protein KIT31_10045 [Deltaproteobacteria bacterium]|nr:hypothetical protein [Deltaproteobacteria bacterium]
MNFALVITLLLGLSNFGLQPNPKAATAEQALQYAMPDADIVAHFDAVSVIPSNFKALLALADQPQIKATPELAKMVRQVINEIDGARGLAKSTSGIDVTTDVYDATVFVQLPAGREPIGVVAVRGKFSGAVVEKIARTIGQTPTKIGGGSLVSLERTPRDDGGALAVTKDGVLLVGTQRLLKDRLADTWKAPARPAGSLLAAAADAITGKPVFSVVMSLSAAAKKHVLDLAGNEKNFATDLVQRHKVASLSMFHDGVGWTWTDATKEGMEQVAMMSEGALELMRAAHIGPRGIAKMAVAALESYRGVDKQLDEVIKRKADILKIVDTYTGDGNFKVAIDRDPAKYRVNVRATGKSLAEVVPATLLLPVGAVALLGFGTKKKDAMSTPVMAPVSAPSGPMKQVAPPPPPPPPAKRPTPAPARP